MPDSSSRPDDRELELESTIGFNGSFPGSLLVHPDGQHYVFSLGSTVVIRDKNKPRNQYFLQGHTNSISCLVVSKSGKYLASGQVTHQGFQADVIIWDYETKTLFHRLTLHKVKVEALAFSPTDSYLTSLGGEDDCSIVVWDVQRGKAVCACPASKDSDGVARCVEYSNNDDCTFITGGNHTLRVWTLEPHSRTLRAQDCQTGILKRVVVKVSVDETDDYIYCGTTTGDILQVNLKTRMFKMAGPQKDKEKFSLGTLSLALGPDFESMVVGAGDGTVAILKRDTFKLVKTWKLRGKVTSVIFDGHDHILAGTSESNMYRIEYATDREPVKTLTCHYSGINDLCFPSNYSDLFATCSANDIRIWNSQTSAELLRITVPNLECNCIVFKKDGTSLISGWNDRKIRAFGPETGRIQYTINDVHKNGVTAIAVTDVYNENGDFRIVSGGADGQVRIWRITRQTQVLEAAMKEHKGMVTCIQIRRNNLECVSASSDGSCIIWDLTRHVRNQVLFAPSFFKAVSYFPDESQLLTSGTDRKVAYWEAFDGSLIRELEGSQSDSINGLDISHDGKFFVIGGSDKLVKFYRYEEGDVIFIGVGHSADITKVKISPDHRHVISVSSDGAIFRWVFPVAVGKRLIAPILGTNVQFSEIPLQDSVRQGELVEVN